MVLPRCAVLLPLVLLVNPYVPTTTAKRESRNNDNATSLRQEEQQLPPLPSIYVSCPNTPEGHYACGYSIGVRFSSNIGESIRSSSLATSIYAQLQQHREESNISKLEQTFLQMKQTANDTYPLYVKELEGTADGSGQPLDQILVLNFLQEISLVYRNDTSWEWERQQQRRRSGALPDRCTDVLLSNMFAHNEDGFGVDVRTMYRVHYRTYDPTSGETVEQFNAMTYPGRLSGWGPGYNRHGIVWSSNMLYPSLQSSSPYLGGLATIFVSRAMTKARTIQEAVGICTPSNLIAGQNQNFGDVKTGEVVTVETAPGGKFDMLRISDDQIHFHANQYLRMTDIDQLQDHLPSSIHRHARFEEMRANLAENVDGLLTFLGDQADPKYPVYRHDDANGEYTLFTIAFDISERVMRIFRGNPKEGGLSLLSEERIDDGTNSL